MNPVTIDVEWREIKEPSPKVVASVKQPLDKVMCVNMVVIGLMTMFWSFRITMGVIGNYQYWSENGGVTFQRLIFGM